MRNSAGSCARPFEYYTFGGLIRVDRQRLLAQVLNPGKGWVDANHLADDVGYNSLDYNLLTNAEAADRASELTGSAAVLDT